MQRAIILFHVESGSENKVLKKVRKIEGVEEAYISYGMYDLAVKIKAVTMDQLKDIISNKLRKISEVISTTSLLLIEN